MKPCDQRREDLRALVCLAGGVVLFWLLARVCGWGI